jgi:hypothetical protein|tara:strand:+ start:1148 stop:1336 length:189 start_codon:yes stop_codon:yes gene_type:complete
MSKPIPKTTKEHILHIYNKLDLLENNHLKHMQRDIDRLNYILWAIGFMVATQFVSWILRMFG